MIEYVLYDLPSSEISLIVRDLKNKGLLVGIDFDFAYITGRYDYATDSYIPRQTRFLFYNEPEGLLFVLRYS